MLLRHGLSEFNHVTNVFSELTGLDFFSPEARELQMDCRLIDSPLHEQGVLQVTLES